MDIIEREGLVERAAPLGVGLLEALGELCGERYVKEVRGQGMMAAVEFHPGQLPGGAAAVATELRRRGVFTRYCADILMFAPPLVISEAERDERCNAAVSSARHLSGAA